MWDMFPQTIPMTGSSIFEKAFHLLAQGKASRAFGLPRSAANAVSGRKPGPTLSAEKRNAAVPCALEKVIPPHCPYVALCEEIRRRAAHVPTNQDAAAVGPLQTKGEAKKLMPKELLYFPFQCRIFTF